MNNNKNEFLQIRIKKDLKQKLIYDAVKYRFPSMTAYLEKLIETGLPVSDSLDLRLKLIDEKIDSMNDNMITFHNRNFSIQDKFFKRIYVVFRLVGYSLARLFFLKPGPVLQDNKDDANSIIRWEIDETEKKFGENSKN